MSVDRWMDKEVVVHNSAIKIEHLWLSSNEMDEPRACYTEWSKSEKERQGILMHIYWI